MRLLAIPDALLFDFGGVIAHLDWHAIFRHWAGIAGRDSLELRACFRFDENYERFDCGEIDGSTYFKWLRKSLRIELTDAQFAEGWARLFVGPVVETTEIVRALSGKVPLYIFSNTNSLHYAIWSKDYAGALLPFTTVFTSCQIGKRKPDGAAFRHVADEIGIPPEKMLFFDDTRANVHGAQSVGLQAIHVRSSTDVRSAVARWL